MLSLLGETRAQSRAVQFSSIQFRSVPVEYSSARPLIGLTLSQLGSTPVSCSAMRLLEVRAGRAALRTRSCSFVPLQTAPDSSHDDDCDDEMSKLNSTRAREPMQANGTEICARKGRSETQWKRTEQKRTKETMSFLLYTTLLADNCSQQPRTQMAHYATLKGFSPWLGARFEFERRTQRICQIEPEYELAFVWRQRNSEKIESDRDESFHLLGSVPFSTVGDKLLAEACAAPPLHSKWFTRQRRAIPIDQVEQQSAHQIMALTLAGCGQAPFSGAQVCSPVRAPDWTAASLFGAGRLAQTDLIRQCES